MKFRHVAALVIVLPALGACVADDKLNPPDVSDPMFLNYIALGNSISAGFQSLGWNDSTQKRAFPVLLAAAANAPFSSPTFQARGCPPPLTNNVTLTRVGGGSISTCDLRVIPPPQLVHNLAVPGASVIDALSHDSTSIATDFFYFKLTNFVLGGRTMIETLEQAKPTFVTIELGANDVLGALIDTTNPGNPAQVTTTAAFQSRYTRLLDRVEATGAKAILIGVPDITAAPYASSGSTYWCIKNQPACGFAAGPLPPSFTVNNNCAPALTMIPGAKGDSVLVPWIRGVKAILIAAQTGLPTTVDCSVDLNVVLPSEYALMRTAVSDFNLFIAAQATARGWAYFDANALLQGLREAARAIGKTRDTQAVDRCAGQHRAKRRLPAWPAARVAIEKIGRASCRERVYVLV